MPQSYSIADLAREFGVTHRTIRFYEAEGLLAPARKGRRRVYRPRDRVRLMMILRGRGIGLGVAAIRELLAMFGTLPAAVDRDRLLRRIDGYRADLAERRRDADLTLRALDDLAARLRAADAGTADAGTADAGTADAGAAGAGAAGGAAPPRCGGA